MILLARLTDMMQSPHATSMTCNRCKRLVRPGATACPYCRRGGSNDGIVLGMGMVFAIIGIAVGAIAFADNVFLKFFSIVVGLFFGVFIGAQCLAVSQQREAKRRELENIEDRIYYQEYKATQAETMPVQSAPLDFVAVARQQEALLLASGDYRKCPHCAELIKGEAKVCRFCQREVALRAGANR